MVRQPNRAPVLAAALLVLVSLAAAYLSIRRGIGSVDGSVDSTTTTVSWVGLVAGLMSAVEGLIAIRQLLRRDIDGARRALYVAVVSGSVSIVGAVLALLALAAARRGR